MKEVLSEIACVKAPDFAQMFYVNPSFGPDAIGAILLVFKEIRFLFLFALLMA